MEKKRLIETSILVFFIASALIIFLINAQNNTENEIAVNETVIATNNTEINQTISVNETINNQTASNITLNKTESNITISNKSETNTTITTTNETLNETIINETIKEKSINETISNMSINETVDEVITETENRTRYIVEFNKEPLLKRFENEKLLEKEKSKIHGEIVREIEVEDYKKELKKEHSLAVDDIESLLGKREPPIIKIMNTILLLINKILKSLVVIIKRILYIETGAVIKLEINETQLSESSQPINSEITESSKETGVISSEKSNNKETPINENISSEPTLTNETLITTETVPSELTRPIEIDTELEFYNVFNGIVLNLTEKEVEKIRQSKFVKGVYPDEEVGLTLNESINLINADEVWKLDVDGSSCSLTNKTCLTGKGITIAILDTGVDYTHPDLGWCFGNSTLSNPLTIDSINNTFSESNINSYCSTFNIMSDEDDVFVLTKNLNTIADGSCQKSLSQNELELILSRRKNLLLNLIESNPERALLVEKLNNKVVNSLSKEILSQLVETRGEFIGELEVIHFDDFENPENSIFRNFLHVNESVYELFIEGNEPVYLSGFTVKVQGIEADNKIALQSQDKGFVEILVETTNPKSENMGNQQTLVIVAGIGTLAPITTVENARNLIFNKTYDFYIKNSFNKSFIKGDVVGPYNLSSTICNYIEQRDAALKAAAPDVNLLNYSRVVMLIPATSCTPYGGLGTLGKNSVSTLDGTIKASFSWDYYTSPYIPFHEFGHNFGVHHANSYNCKDNNGRIVPYSSSCTSTEYGDRWDIMGTSYGSHLNAAHKADIGWLTAENSITTREGDYILKPLEIIAPKGEIQLIKLPITSVNPNRYFTLEWRRPYDYDNRLSNDAYNGLSIHTASLPDNSFSFLQTNILDLNNSLYDHQSLLPKKSFLENINGYNVTLNEITSEGASVSVRFFREGSEGNKTSCKVIGGYDFVNKDGNPIDDHYHGTHAASIAAGNGKIKGVAPDANILAYKVINSYGTGYSSWIISGIERAVDPNKDGNFSDHATIISMSVGSSGNPDDAQSRAVDNAVNSGVVVVAAAGNSGPSNKTITSPGTARKAITVGAVDKFDKLASFSSRGPVIWYYNGSFNTINKPDIVAPGVNIYAAVPGSYAYYKILSGTSMAAPHVSGAVALLLQKNPSLTPENVKQILKDSSIVLSYNENEVGSGRLDVLNAVNKAVPCNNGDIRSCGLDIGICTKGTETCINERWGECTGNKPKQEICDGLDNDCDNAIDENLIAPKCDLNLGVCSNAFKICGGTSGWLPCNVSIYGINYEVKEKSCWDSLDNDCDGLQDVNESELDCSCNLNNAYWSYNKTNETTPIFSKGDWISLGIQSNDKSCMGLKFRIEVREDELLKNESINLTYFSYMWYSNYLQKAQGYNFWSIDYIDYFTKAANYYFIAYPDSYSTKNVKSLSSRNFENGILIVKKPVDSDGDGVEDSKDLCPKTPYYLKGYVDIVGCPIPISTKFDIVSWNYNIQSFLNWSNISIYNLSRFEIGNKRFGKITYPYQVDLRKKVGDYHERLDLDSYIKIEKDKIEVDTSNLSIFSQDANITMFNVTLNDPIILKDGKVCTDCIINSWNKSSRTFIFKVPHFTVYELVERTNLPKETSDTSGIGGGGGGGGSSSTGSGGGGGGGFTSKIPTDEKVSKEQLEKAEEIYKWKKTFSEDDKELDEKEEIEKDLEKNQRLTINIYNKTHYIGIVEINETGVEIEIGGIVEIKEFINFGDEKFFDVNGDNLHDFSVNFERILDGKTFLKLKTAKDAEKTETEITDFFRKFLRRIKSLFIKN